MTEGSYKKANTCLRQYLLRCYWSFPRVTAYLLTSMASQRSASAVNMNHWETRVSRQPYAWSSPWMILDRLNSCIKYTHISLNLLGKFLCTMRKAIHEPMPMYCYSVSTVARITNIIQCQWTGTQSKQWKLICDEKYGKRRFVKYCECGDAANRSVGSLQPHKHSYFQ